MFFIRFQVPILRSPLAPIVTFFCVFWPQMSHAQPSPAQVDRIERQNSPDYQFSPDEEQLLDAVQKGCFNYFWQEVGEPAQLAKDRRTTLVASVAGIGFQLSSLPIGVERGWITKQQALERALTILRTLEQATGSRRDGFYLHFVHADDGSLYEPYDNEISTVDTTLLLAGAMPAATYFGGEVAETVSRMAARVNWPQFQVPESGFVSFAWKPTDNSDVSGEGKLMDHTWHLATDEERLVYFVGCGSPEEDYALDPELYYRLERHLGRLDDMQPFVLTWNGALFTYFFSHCWINYHDLEADNPARFGVEGPRVDWLENSRRGVLAHRQRCIQFADKWKTLAPSRWGLAPCMGYVRGKEEPDYLVPDVLPNLSKIEQLHEGTVAPYAAGSAIMFTPQESLVALATFRNLTNDNGEHFLWQDPEMGGYGFVDSFNLDLGKACDDNVAIDVGPMLLAIENARTGLIWKLFMEHDIARRAVERLQLESR